MPGWSFQFDPVTNDLVDDGKGSFVRTFTAQTHVQLQVRCRAGQCWQDPLLGSFFFDLSRFQAAPDITVPGEMRRCLGVLEKRGRIANIDVASQQRSPTRIDVQAKCRDTSTGQPVTASIKAGG